MSLERMNIGATLADAYRDKLFQDERRYEKQDLLKAILDSTNDVDYISDELKARMATTTNDFKIPAIKDGEAIVVDEPSFDLDISNDIETATYAVTPFNIVSQYTLNPSDFYDNYLTMNTAGRVKMDRIAAAVTKKAEEHIISTLESNTTQDGILEYFDQVNAGGNSFSFNGTDDVLEVDITGAKDTLYYDYENLLKNNLVMDDNDRLILATSKGGSDAIIKEMNKNGLYNSENKAWNGQYAPMIYQTGNIAPNSNLFEGFIFPSGSIGLYSNHPPAFVRGEQFADGQLSVSNSVMPGVGIVPNIYEEKSKLDNSGAKGIVAKMDSTYKVQFFFRFFLTYRYNSDQSTRVSDFTKVRAKLTNN